VTIVENFEQIRKEIEERLTYVMSTKEAAVQQTLADTEDSLAMIGELKALIAMQHDVGAQSHQMGIEFVPQAAALLEQIQQRLMQILMTQGYQDLTGQVLKRVMADLAHIDNSALVHATDVGVNPTQGFGPAALANEKKGRVEAQDDVDDLLNSLGI
jgi:chemotaxis protein CheZ